MFKKIIYFLSLFFILGISEVKADVLDIQAKGFVTDDAAVLSEQGSLLVEKIAYIIEQKTSAEISFVSVNSIAPYAIEDFSVRLFEKWKIGKKGKDNGILIVFAKQERRVRIEVGYGLEGILPDGLCGQIIRENMLPYFKQGDFTKGIADGIFNIALIIAKEHNIDLENELKSAGYADQIKNFQKNKLSDIIRFVFILLFVIIVLMGRLGVLPFFLLGAMGSGRRSYWHGNDFRSGFGGGFGGFGGGSSGGGGASGGW